MIKITILSAAALLVASCSSFGGQTDSQTSSALANISPEQQVVMTKIKDDKIPTGECGFLLWTLDSKQPVPVMRFLVGKTAQIALGGRQHNLTLNGASGGASFGVYENQQFSSDNGDSVKVAIELGQGFDGGIYLQRGLITIDSTDGWRSVTPVAGIAGCRS